MITLKVAKLDAAREDVGDLGQDGRNEKDVNSDGSKFEKGAERRRFPRSSDRFWERDGQTSAGLFSRAQIAHGLRNKFREAGDRFASSAARPSAYRESPERFARF
jgi:hypothetical protein